MVAMQSLIRLLHQRSTMRELNIQLGGPFIEVAIVCGLTL